MSAIGAQLRDPRNSGLTQWRLAVLNIIMDAAAESRGIPYVSTRFSLSMEMSRLTRDGTAEPVSRDQILRRERGQGNIHFSSSADHVQDWQPYPVDPYSYFLCVMTIHIYFCIHRSRTIRILLIYTTKVSTCIAESDIQLHIDWLQVQR